MKNDPVQIRPATSDDRVSQRAVTRSAFESAYSHIFNLEEIADVFEGRVEGSGSWDGVHVKGLGSWVAELDGELVGTSSLLLCDGGDAELRALYVLPAHHGRGIGLRLWDKNLSIAWSQGCPAMRVWTLENGAAVEFYKRRGCWLIERGAYHVGEHAEPTVGFRIATD